MAKRNFTLPFSIKTEFSGFEEAADQLGSFVNSKTGAHLTGSQNEANAFSARMAEEEFARQEEFYLKYQSPQAMLRQGVNPFGINGSAGGHSVSGGAPSSVSPSAPQSSNLFDIVQMLFGMQQQKRLNDSQIELNDSAVQRNLSEANERNINSETLKDMNLADIMQKLSNVELNTENVKLIASKVLNTDEDTKLKTSQINKLVVEVLNIEADTNVKQQQLGLIFSEIMRNNKSIELMDAQINEISSIIAVNKEQADVLKEEFNGLVQEHGHQAIMNAFSEVTASRDSGEENGYYRVVSEVKRFINAILGWWSGTTSIDLPHKKPARIGFK